ncbi:MAG: Chromosomal replication initiator protein DnaA [Phycisphaerae bacterium]|nr:Chromosomal replication initiator protein DnaA [Phycisphaerae bacterium]
MNADTRGCLDRIAKQICDQVGPRKYQVWFKNSTRLRLDGEHLQVSVPNQFIGQWIEKHFADDIAAAASDVIGKRPKIHTTVDPTLFANLRKRQLDHQANSVSRQIERATPPQRSNGNGNGHGNGKLHHPAGGDIRLKFRLEDFVVGDSNRLAYQCASEVVADPGKQFNPLFIHGGCGLGKTHLLQGVCKAFNDRQMRWMYVSAEEFTNQFLWAIRSKKLDAFRARFRQLEVLVIDDVHFLSDKKATQSEFLHTFNEINTAGRQIVMASDAHPKLIGQLAEPLVNRFISGMVARIDKPDLQTRRTILKRRAGELGLSVSAEVVDFVAQNVEDNVRELEGALFKLLAYRSIDSGPLSLGSVRTMLSDHISTIAPAVKLGDVEAMVATYFGLRPADLHSSRKSRTVSTARSVAMYLARKHTGLSFPDIGKYMGNKNHATVIQACRRIDKRLADDLVLEWQTSDGAVSLSTREVVDRIEKEMEQ